MEQPLLLQARQFLLSAALGAALGLHYDLLRGLRRWARWLTHPLDLWFALSVLAANLWFALRIGGGQFRIFALVGSALGAAGYFAGPSRLLLPNALLETFYGPRTPPCPRKQKFFRKNGNFFEKHLFIGEKIGYNKKQTPPHAAARYQQRGRRAGCACENHHSLQNF